MVVVVWLSCHRRYGCHGVVVLLPAKWKLWYGCLATDHMIGEVWLPCYDNALQWPLPPPRGHPAVVVLLAACMQRWSSLRLLLLLLYDDDVAGWFCLDESAAVATLLWSFAKRQHCGGPSAVGLFAVVRRQSALQGTCLWHLLRGAAMHSRCFPNMFSGPPSIPLEALVLR